MSAEASGEIIDGQAPVAWDPNRYLRQVDMAEASLSRGFLRCRPEKWFPGIAAHWLPLAHSLGVDLKVIEVKPVLSAPKGLSLSYAATVDDEPLAFLLDEEAANSILETVSPGGGRTASQLVLEYLARRLLSSLELSWSGPESSVVQFDSEMSVAAIRPRAAVKLTVAFNNTHCVLWIVLGKLLVDRLDGLWRRQVQAANRSEGSRLVHLEISQLAVPPSMLSEYTKAGALIDLEIPVSDTVALYDKNAPWLPVRLCRIEDKLGFEVVSGPVTPAKLPQGTTRLAIELGGFELSEGQSAELSQIGAIWQSTLAVSNNVSLVINQERVAVGELCTFEGRFAVKVT